MRLDLLKKLYVDNHLPEERYLENETWIIGMDAWLECVYDHGIDVADTFELDAFVAQMVRDKTNTVTHFIHMMRYFRVTKQHELFVRLTQYTGALDVMESMYEKMETVIGKSRKEAIEKDFPVPELGTEILKMNRFTEAFSKRIMQDCSESETKRILTDNHHKIPRDAFKTERLHYEASESLEAYLKDLHQRKVDELTEFYKNDRVWYEQIITQDVIDFVKGNQEIMSAVLKDDALYITKIPYDTNAYLKADTPELKAYHACHCPFAKASILEKDIKIDARWCYCSAGFTKLPFEVALDRELPIECIASALNLDPICRFKIDLKDIPHK